MPQYVWVLGLAQGALSWCVMHRGSASSSSIVTQGNRELSGRCIQVHRLPSSCGWGTIARHSTFFIWNLIMVFTLLTLAIMFSLWVSKEESLLAFFRPGPGICGICLIKNSKAKNASYFLTNFYSYRVPSAPQCPCGGYSCGYSLGVLTGLLVS